jgi:hypothetical protein
VVGEGLRSEEGMWDIIIVNKSKRTLHDNNQANVRYNEQRSFFGLPNTKRNALRRRTRLSPSWLLRNKNSCNSKDKTAGSTKTTRKQVVKVNAAELKP